MTKQAAVCLTLCMAACTISPGLAGTYSQMVLSDNPLVYYRLGETPGATVAVDSSVHAHNGIYGGAPVLGVPGLLSNDTDTAVNFNGSITSPLGPPVGGYVTIGDVSYLNLANTAYSVEAWVNGLATNANRRIFDKSLANLGIGYGLDIATSQVRLLGSTELQYFPSGPFSSSQTYYIVGTTDGIGHGSIFVNGMLVLTGTYSATQNYSGLAHIGIANDGTEEAVGILDEVAVYGYALTASQVAAHYNAASAPEPSTGILIGLTVAGILAYRWRRI